jgi:carbamoyl-phosphate synthase large subunit
MTTADPDGPLNVLVSSAGRRVGLMNLFRAALNVLARSGTIIATDVSPLAAAWQTADVRCLVPRCNEPEFVPRLLDICREHSVRLVVPTIDPELPVLAEHRAAFDAIGTTVLVSSPEAVRIAGNKTRTHAWLTSNGFPTVRQTSVDEALRDPANWPLPLIAKPRNGSASIGVVRVTDRAVLQQLPDGSQYVVQSLASGPEHTVDVLIDRRRRAVCAVPRRRVEVRAGEISKGVTVRAPSMENLAAEVCERLPGAYGPMNVQMCCASDGTLAVIEINARFGGGFPLSAHAGADFPRWILEEVAGLPSTARADSWRPGVAMLRYDAEVFLDSVELSGPA